MGAYERLVLPRMVELTCGGAGMERFRRRATEGLHGTVLEIGFGTGLNLACYPSEVTHVIAVEPNEGARELAAPRLDAADQSVEFVGVDGASLPIEDESVDGALSTFTLCTIADVRTAVSEVRRVLRPGGQFHFLEHGRAPDESVRRWQRRLEPLQQRIAGGCHLTRDAEAIVSDGGFELTSFDGRYVRGPKPWSYFTLATFRRR